MKRMLLVPILCAAGFAFGQANTAAAPPQDLNPQAGPPMLGIHWARGFKPNARIANEAQAARARRSPNMTYHGGKIMPTAVTKAIFWGTSWGSYSGDKISGMDLWYNGFNISNYAKTSDEYTGTNGQVTASTNHLGHIVDTSASTGGGNTSTILSEVCKAIGSPDSSGNGYYAVYADTPRGNARLLRLPQRRNLRRRPRAVRLLLQARWRRGLRPGGHLRTALAGLGCHRQCQRPRTLRSTHRPRQSRRLV